MADKINNNTQKTYKTNLINTLNGTQSDIYVASDRVSKEQLVEITPPNFIYDLNINSMYLNLGTDADKPIKTKEGKITYPATSKYYGISLRYDDNTSVIGVAVKAPMRLDDAVKRGRLSLNASSTQIAYFDKKFNYETDLGENAQLAYLWAQQKILANANKNNTDYHKQSTYFEASMYFMTAQNALLRRNETNGGVQFNWTNGTIKPTTEAYNWLIMRKTFAEGLLARTYENVDELIKVGLNDRYNDFDANSKLYVGNFNYEELAKDVKSKNITTIADLVSLIRTYETVEKQYTNPREKINQFFIQLKELYYTRDNNLHNPAYLHKLYQDLNLNSKSLLDLIERLSNREIINLQEEIENIKKNQLPDELKDVSSSISTRRPLTANEAAAIVIGLQNRLAYNTFDEIWTKMVREYDKIGKLLFTKQNETGDESAAADEALNEFKPAYVSKKEVVNQLNKNIIDNNYFMRTALKFVVRKLQEAYPEYKLDGLNVSDLIKNGKFSAFDLRVADLHYDYSFAANQNASYTTKLEALNIYDRSNYFNPTAYTQTVYIDEDGEYLPVLDENGNAKEREYEVDGEKRVAKIYKHFNVNLIPYDWYFKKSAFNNDDIDSVVALLKKKGKPNYNREYRLLVQNLYDKLRAAKLQIRHYGNLKTPAIEDVFAPTAEFVRVNNLVKVSANSESVNENSVVSSKLAAIDDETSEDEIDATTDEITDLDTNVHKTVKTASAAAKAPAAAAAAEPVETDAEEDDTPDWMQGVDTEPADEDEEIAPAKPKKKLK